MQLRAVSMNNCGFSGKIQRLKCAAVGRSAGTKNALLLTILRTNALRKNANGDRQFYKDPLPRSDFRVR
jgi:hypothetical protein